MVMNLNGILYRAWAFGGVLLLIEIILFAAGEKKRCAAIARAAFYVLYIGFYLWTFLNPKIAVYEGNFVYTKGHTHVAPFTRSYMFGDENNQKKKFYLDIFTKKTMIPFELQTDGAYRVYYEEHSSIIVGVEEISE